MVLGLILDVVDSDFVATAMAQPVATIREPALEARPAPAPPIELGKLELQVFPHGQYQSRPHVNDVVHVPNGLVYAATNDGVAEFDGSRWRLIETPAPASVLVANATGLIYVGCEGDFGVLTATDSGQLVFQSLKELVPAKVSVGIIESIAVGTRGIVYQSRDFLFHLASETRALTIHPSQPGVFSCVRFVNDQMLVGNAVGGSSRLLALDESAPQPEMPSLPQEMPGSLPFASSLTPLLVSHNLSGLVLDIVPLDARSLLVLTHAHGLYLYRDDDFERLDGEASDLARRSSAWCLKRCAADRFLMGTNRDGAVVFNSRGDILRIIDRDNDLPSNRILAIAPDSTQRGWWLATTSGLARVDLFSPVQYFDRDLGLPDVPHAVVRFKDRVLVATFSSLLALQPNAEPGRVSRFEPLDVDTGDRRSMLAVHDRLLAGGGGFDGLDEVVNIDDVRSSKVFGYISRLMPSSENDIAIAATIYMGLKVLGPVGDEWTELGPVPGTASDIRDAVTGTGNRLWLVAKGKNGGYWIERVDWAGPGDADGESQGSTQSKHPLLDPGQVTVSSYGETKGVPATHLLTPFGWQGDFYVSSPAGLFRYDDEADRFVSDQSLHRRMAGPEPVFGRFTGDVRAAADSAGRLWFSSNDGSLARIADTDSQPQFAWAMHVLAGKRTSGIYTTEDGLIWAGTGDGTLIRYDPNLEPAAAPLTAPLLREVRSPTDALLPTAGPLELPYSTGTMRITFSLARYVAPARHRYQYRLNGLTDDWSVWTSETYREFTSLREGNYQFEVRATDELQRQSPTASFAFRVLPPWYRAWWAYSLYFVATACGVAGAVAIRVRHHRAEIERLESTVASHTVTLREANASLEHRVAERTAEREELIRDLEARNAELERFTYTVSHDLRSPLITIKGFLGVLKRDLDAGDTERLDHDLARIGNAAVSMDQLLSDLLEMSRIGRVVNPYTVVPFEELARAAAELVVGDRDKEIDLEIDPELPVLSCDRTRMMEVFTNLIDNAVKFSRDGVRTRLRIGVREDSSTKAVVTFVEDNGIGIAPQYLGNVFRLFEQLDQRKTGTGVGLAIVQRIIEVHNGRLWVESKGEGHGATFCFTLGNQSGDAT